MATGTVKWFNYTKGFGSARQWRSGRFRPHLRGRARWHDEPCGRPEDQLRDRAGPPYRQVRRWISEQGSLIFFARARPGPERAASHGCTDGRAKSARRSCTRSGKSLNQQIAEAPEPGMLPDQRRGIPRLFAYHAGQWPIDIKQQERNGKWTVIDAFTGQPQSDFGSHDGRH